MSLVEGIGDEVMMVVVVFLLMAVFLIAWMSTSVHERNFVSILIFETRHRLMNQAAAGQAHGQSNESGPHVPHQSESVQPQETRSDEHQNDRTEAVQPPAFSSSDTLPRSDAAQNDENSSAVDDCQNNTTDSNNVGGEYDGINSSESHLSENVTNTGPTEPPAVSSLPDTLSELRRRRVEALTKTSASESLEQVAQSCGLNMEQPELNSSQWQSENHSSPSESTSPSPSQTEENRHSQSEERTQTSQSETPVYDPENGLIRLRLRFLSEVERHVQGRMQETVAQLRSREFAAELEENKIIRFIFNGRELKPDTQTLQTFNIGDSSIIHCLIAQGTQGQTQGQGQGHQQEHIVDLDLSRMMLPLFGLILAILWYFRIVYKVYFNPMSTITLVGFTIMFAVALASAFTPQRREDNVQVHRHHVHAE
ncbi:transmembrane and ubiquitin-like domain-containing protein 1 [Lingula anatina]|uniref:Transmembrane and ubiquitin-like domain-containing protein 1 n=1 Tax=Lingula anatina TaxID=7574 RepID=A0A1S3HXA8_LINAN|nr:transmembrane and ubiquitin-like domain-containing protein 1 [Lingula anatina]|eukprot:XP_013390196.1 transmembrane and ubiquitin-like domain-containing protein 1 [Lingula anatina]